MRNIIRFILVCALLFFMLIGSVTTAISRQRSDSLQISLITSGPGNDLYTTFGHSAVRVHDFTTGEDYIFNYGTFDFSTSHFYWKFVRGRLMYFLSVQHFADFLQAYKAEDRKIIEQILNLNTKEKQDIFNYLKTNYLPKNRFYKYDFLFDNCATRISDIFDDTFGDSWKIKDIIPRKELSFRQIINSYLKDSPWERLGINLMFGSHADKAMTNKQIMFLPDFLMKGLANSTVGGKPLVKHTEVRYNPTASHAGFYPFYKHPLFWFSLLGLLIVLLSFMKITPFTDAVLSWVDRCLFFLTGLLGCFLIFMWAGTDHQITVWNYNILWLLPANIVFSFYFFKNTKWVQRYALLLLGIDIVLLAGWFVLPQELPLATIPIMIAIAVRSWKIALRVKNSY